MALLNIRPATVADAGLILHFIRELAIYEKAEHSVQTDEIGIAESLFGADATARALICEADGEPIGYAVYFYNYSTWLGRKGIYLEDLYVSQEKRGAGAGKALLEVHRTPGRGRRLRSFRMVFWTGIPRPSSSTPPLAPRRRTSGPCTDCRARHCTISPTVEAKCIHAWRGSTNLVCANRSLVGANRNPVGANLGSHSLRTKKKPRQSLAWPRCMRGRLILPPSVVPAMAFHSPAAE